MKQKQNRDIASAFSLSSSSSCSSPSSSHSMPLPNTDGHAGCPCDAAWPVIFQYIVIRHLHQAAALGRQISPRWCVSPLVTGQLCGVTGDAHGRAIRASRVAALPRAYLDAHIDIRMGMPLVVITCTLRVRCRLSYHCPSSSTHRVSRDYGEVIVDLHRKVPLTRLNC